MGRGGDNIKATEKVQLKGEGDDAKLDEIDRLNALVDKKMATLDLKPGDEDFECWEAVKKGATVRMTQDMPPLQSVTASTDEGGADGEAPTTF
jgi:hypothetical protein